MLELDGGHVYLDDDGNLFSLPEDAAVRDRLVDALNASGTSPDYSPLPLISAMSMATAAIAHLGRGRISGQRMRPVSLSAHWARAALAASAVSVESAPSALRDGFRPRRRDRDGKRVPDPPLNGTS